MKSHYSQSSLKKILRYHELLRLNLSVTDFYNDLNVKLESLKNGTYSFELIKRKEFLVIDNFYDKIIERQANRRLRKTYKDRPSNRRTIVKQIISLLNETSDYYIIRTDISKFYESIDRDEVLNKLKNDRILTFETIYLISKLLEDPLLPDTGLPRGISISSTLSEMYMRSYDRTINSMENVFYYERFVDDIIIFCSTKYTAEHILETQKDFLPNGLSINKKKTQMTSYHELTVNNDSFEYLGYKFEIDVIKRNKVVDVRIAIADKKMKKLKTRIVNSFLAFILDSDFQILKKRIEFLSSNYILRGGEESSLLAGLSYNYIFVNRLECLDELNLFYHKMIHSKNGSFGRKWAGKVSSAQKEILMKISFKHRFSKRNLEKFDIGDISEIKKCWSNES